MGFSEAQCECVYLHAYKLCNTIELSQSFMVAGVGKAQEYGD
jgi:hypothetical protein